MNRHNIPQPEVTLVMLERIAKRLPKGDWRAWSFKIKQPLQGLVGWDAETTDERLTGSEAYNCAFDRLLAVWERRASR